MGGKRGRGGRSESGGEQAKAKQLGRAAGLEQRQAWQMGGRVATREGWQVEVREVREVCAVREGPTACKPASAAASATPGATAMHLQWKLGSRPKQINLRIQVALLLCNCSADLQRPRRKIGKVWGTGVGGASVGTLKLPGLVLIPLHFFSDLGAR